MLTGNSKYLGVVLVILTLGSELSADIFFDTDLPITSKVKLIQAIDANQDLAKKLKVKDCNFNYYLLTDQDFQKKSKKLKLQAFYANGNIYLPKSSIIKQKNLTISIRHEAVHALLDCKYQQRIPVWLEEGLAYFFTDSLRNLAPLDVDELLPINIISQPFGRLSATQRKTAYLQSKYLMKYLLQISNLKSILKYLGSLEHKAAFNQAFAISQEDFLRNFRFWIKKHNQITASKCRLSSLSRMQIYPTK